ncbi:MAG: respiratory nitrate reductase subunit gamma, partial [Acidobacteria bacterium]|nr:respiratory nitrate reductase subunit gamma [Acidobacteriota bacterium]
AVTGLDQFLFVVLPYMVMFIFFVGTIMRYRKAQYTYSSLSSQFLENQQHFWGLVPFHYGIITVLTGHVIAFLVPRSVLLWNSRPLRLYILEISALIFGLLTLIGLVGCIIRRMTLSKIREVTSILDWNVFALLLIQVASGVYVAVFHPWGSAWFAGIAAPYLWSLVKFSPDMSYVVALPFVVKLHIASAYVMIGLAPFTRLVHVLVVPNPYLWRKPQVVRWYRPSGSSQGIS